MIKKFHKNLTTDTASYAGRDNNFLITNEPTMDLINFKKIASIDEIDKSIIEKSVFSYFSTRTMSTYIILILFLKTKEK